MTQLLFIDDVFLRFDDSNLILSLSKSDALMTRVRLLDDAILIDRK